MRRGTFNDAFSGKAEVNFGMRTATLPYPVQRCQRAEAYLHTWLIIKPRRIPVLREIRTHDREAISLFAAKRSVQMVSAEQFMHPDCLIPALDAFGEQLLGLES